MKELTSTTRCHRCEQEVPPDARFCSCGTPTSLASFKERNEYETKLWRARQDQQA